MNNNTIMEFEMADGTKVGMTLAYFPLLQVRTKKKNIFEKYNKVATKGPQDEFDMITILYTGYLCANVEQLESTMTEMDFIKGLPTSREQVANACQWLLNGPKK